MITATEMAALEQRSEEYGVPGSTLMENAGAALAEIIRERHPEGSVLFLTYHGNNGGDGFVAARLLSPTHTVNVWFVGEEEKLRGDAKANFVLLEKEMLVDSPDLSTYDVLVDALLGTGTTGELREPLVSLVPAWDTSRARKVAVDIPTGMHPDTGEHAAWFSPDVVVTFHDMKPGLVKLADRTIVQDIGIPEEACRP